MMGCAQIDFGIQFPYQSYKLPPPFIQREEFSRLALHRNVSCLISLPLDKGRD